MVICLVIWTVGLLIGWLFGYLDGWVVGWMVVGWLIGWLVSYLDGLMVGWLFGCMVGWLGGYLKSLFDGWLVSWLYGWMVGCLAVWMVAFTSYLLGYFNLSSDFRFCWVFVCFYFDFVFVFFGNYMVSRNYSLIIGSVGGAQNTLLSLTWDRPMFLELYEAWDNLFVAMTWRYTLTRSNSIW